MTPERQAEYRQRIADHPKVNWGDSAMIECLDAIAERDRRIAELEASQRWTSTTEPPEASGLIVVRHGNNEDEIPEVLFYHTGIGGCYDSNRDWIRFSNWNEWLPLPKPPAATGQGSGVAGE